MPFSPPRWRRPYTVAAAARVALQAASLLGMMLAVARLPPAMVGDFSVAWAGSVIVSAVVYSGLFEYLLRVSDIDVAKDSVFWLFIGLGALAAGLLGGAALAARVAGHPALSACLLATMPVPVLTGCIGWCDGLLTRRGHSATVAVVGAVAELLGALALAAMLRLTESAWTLAISRLVSVVFGLFGLVLFTECRPRCRVSWPQLAQAWRAALPLQASTFVGSLSNYASDLLLAWHFNPAASASYRIASRLSAAGTDIFAQPLRPMIWDAMAKREQASDPAGLAKVYLEHLRVLTFFAWPTLLCVAVFSERLLAVISRQDWSEAAPILGLLAFARIFAVPAGLLGPVLVCSGHAATMVRTQAAFTGTSLAGLVLVSPWGIMALATFELVRSIANAAYAIWLTRKMIGVGIRDTILAMTSACSVAVACAALGDLAFRALAPVEPLRVCTSILVMGVCLMGCYTVLRGRLELKLPGESMNRS